MAIMAQSPGSGQRTASALGGRLARTNNDMYSFGLKDQRCEFQRNFEKGTALDVSALLHKGIYHTLTRSKPLIQFESLRTELDVCAVLGLELLAGDRHLAARAVVEDGGTVHGACGHARTRVPRLRHC